jgi:hypothetical protein
MSVSTGIIGIVVRLEEVYIVKYNDESEASCLHSSSILPDQRHLELTEVYIIGDATLK